MFHRHCHGLLSALSALTLFVSSIAGQGIARNPVINLCQSPGQFAMTFDQGPSIYTGTLLDALDSRSAKGTFHPVVTYLGEAVVVANLKRAASSGHTIGLSLEASIDLSSMSDDDIMATIDSRAQQLGSITGFNPVFLRLPNYQNMSLAQLNMIISKGYVITTYNLDSYDYKANIDILSSFKNVLDLLSPNTKGEFISVQRDYIQESVDATADILDYVIKKGYTLVTLDQCVGKTGGGNSGSNSNSNAPAPAGNVPSAPAGGSPKAGSNVKQQSDAPASKAVESWAVIACLLLALAAFY